jgi:hypothetical protein
VQLLRGGRLVKKTYDYRHHYRGYWAEGGVCRIRIYEEDGPPSVVICSQLLENKNTSVTNMAEYIAAEVIEHHELSTLLTWIEHYPEHSGAIGEWSLVTFSSREVTEKSLGGVRRRRVGTPSWSYLAPDEVTEALAGVSPNRSAAESTGGR